MTPEAEKQLFAYLAEGRENRKATRKAIEELGTQFRLHEQADELRFEQLREEMRGRVSRLEEEQEDTARHNIQHLQDQLKEQKEGQSWATRFIVQSLVAIAVAGLSGLLGALFTLAMKGK